MIRVFETFGSLQGESTFAGERCFFIRLAGCRLRCAWCDTLQAQAHDCGKEYSAAELTALALASGIPLVEVTGGEPLEQPEAVELLQCLLDAGLQVLLETNGAEDASSVPEGVVRIFDYKLPSSRMESLMLPENFRTLRKQDEVKFVIGSREDFLRAREVETLYDIPAQTAKIIYSPVWGCVDFAELAQWIVESRAPGRMQLQLHKLIWGADAAGV
ncbi:MAG: radical SAM protein [Lentisphaeria bacterium]|nr:radical SAM protein [Lentisphaeria bacterium]